MGRIPDSERILRLIQLEIAEKGDMLEKVDFDDQNTSESLQRIMHQKRYSQVRFAQHVQNAKELEHIEWKRPIVGNPVYAAVKYAVRKVFGFLIKPIVDEQNEANGTMVLFVEYLFRYVREKDHQIVTLMQKENKREN